MANITQEQAYSIAREYVERNKKRIVRGPLDANKEQVLAKCLAGLLIESNTSGTFDIEKSNNDEYLEEFVFDTMMKYHFDLKQTRPMISLDVFMYSQRKYVDKISAIAESKEKHSKLVAARKKLKKGESVELPCDISILEAKGKEYD